MTAMAATSSVPSVRALSVTSTALPLVSPSFLRACVSTPLPLLPLPAPSGRPFTPLNEGFASRPVAPVAVLASESPEPTTSTVIVPARSDGTAVKGYGKGSKRKAVAIATDPALRASATAELTKRVYAPSNTAPQAKLNTWCEVARAAGHSDPLAPDPAVVYDTAAALWQAGYRALDSYLSAARVEMTLQLGSLPEAMAIHFRRVARAAARGRGPPRHATELPLDRLSELLDDEEPLVQAGPCYPRRLAIIASWWMLREIEVGSLTLQCATIGPKAAELYLPASKSDTTGQGTSRSLACTCATKMAAVCPYHNLLAQRAWAAPSGTGRLS